MHPSFQSVVLKQQQLLSAVDTTKEELEEEEEEENSEMGDSENPEIKNGNMNWNSLYNQFLLVLYK